MRATKSVCVLDVFDVFWGHVQEAERNVRENGHRGRLPPDCYGDPWDEDFAAAFEAVKRYVRKFRRDRFFPVPAGLAFRPGPIRAETAHQALMFFLNRPEELHGEMGVLDSPEYLAIKSEALKELEHRSRTRRPASNLQDLPCTKSAKIIGELAMLKACLLEYHIPKKGEVVMKPLTLYEIRAKFFPEWCQPTATRRMQKLFKAHDAAAAYARIFTGDMPPDGFRRRFEDSTMDVESVWWDRAWGESDSAEADDDR